MSTNMLDIIAWISSKGPHEIKVCIIKTDNNPEVFAAVKQLAQA